MICHSLTYATWVLSLCITRLSCARLLAAALFARAVLARARRLRSRTLFIWGFDYNLTNISEKCLTWFKCLARGVKFKGPAFCNSRVCLDYSWSNYSQIPM